MAYEKGRALSGLPFFNCISVYISFFSTRRWDSEEAADIIFFSRITCFNGPDFSINGFSVRIRIFNRTLTGVFRII